MRSVSSCGLSRAVEHAGLLDDSCGEGLASVGSCDMSDKAHFTTEQARAAGEQIGIDWGTSPFDVERFRMGMDVELEHGTQDRKTNVTDDDVVVTATEKARRDAPAIAVCEV